MELNKIIDLVTENSTSMLNENMGVTDIAQSPEFIGKLVKQVFSKSILSRITSVMPMKKPSGFIYNLLAYYQGKDSDNNFNNTKILFLDKAYTGDLNTNISTSSGAVITAEHFEGNYVLVKIVSGVVLKGNTFTYKGIAYTVNEVYSSKIAVKKLFKNYSAVTDENQEPNQMGITIERAPVEVGSRKIKTTITQETIQDLKAQYGDLSDDFISEIISSEVALEIDKEIIDYMRSIATIKTDLVLKNTNSTDVIYAFNAIVAKINRELVSLSKKHGKNITGFVVCSNNIVSALISAGVMSFGKSGSLDIQVLSDNDNAVGVMQQYVTVIQDKFADEDYVLVGWKQDDNNINGVDGNAGVIYSPYSLSIVDFIEPTTGRVNKMVINRYAFTRNSFDEGTATSSDFFSTFNVDFSSLIGYTD
jgi:hypothetical protein